MEESPLYVEKRYEWLPADVFDYALYRTPDPAQFSLSACIVFDWESFIFVLELPGEL